jgi:hypothetical protein
VQMELLCTYAHFKSGLFNADPIIPTCPAISRERCGDSSLKKQTTVL